MSLAASGALLAVGILLLYAGAEALVRGSAALALRMGVSRLIVGLTVVSLATSSPELVVCLEAALKGSGDIAVGSVVGSNISNLALILGVAAIVRPLTTERHLIKSDMPTVLGCSLLLVALLLDGALTRVEGVVLTAGLFAYFLMNVARVRRGKPTTRVEEARLPTADRGIMWRDILLVVGGLGVLVLGADTLLTGAIATAERFGISDAVVGLTLVALGTSLPELATSTVAAFKHEGDIAIGNVIGSNVLNILAILGPAAVISPLSSPEVDLVDLLTLMGITAMAMLFMRTGFKVRRWEGLLMLALYALYVGYLLN